MIISGALCFKIASIMTVSRTSSQEEAQPESIYYYQNKADGTNTFLPRVKIGAITASSWIMDLSSADFNNDGFEDFVVSGNNKTSYLFQGNGNGAFTQTTLASPASAAALRGKTAADVDRDGKVDLFIGSYSDGALYLYRGSGNGAFSLPVKIGTSGTDPYGGVARDFDEDGRMRLIASNSTSGGANLFKGIGDGTFAAPVSVPSLNTSSSAAFDAGDFNNDGHLDIIAANCNSKNIVFYPGRGDGSFSQKVQLAATAYCSLGISALPIPPEALPVTGQAEPVPSQTYSFTWNTGGTYAGAYQVHAVLSEDSRAVSENRSSFEILPDMSAQARGDHGQSLIQSERDGNAFFDNHELERKLCLRKSTATVAITGPGGRVQRAAQLYGNKNHKNPHARRGVYLQDLLEHGDEYSRDISGHS